MSNSIITAGWLFFAGWSAALAALAGIAFGRDLMPVKVHIDSTQKASSRDSARHSPIR